MGIPHDPATLFIYALLGVAGWAIWKGSRSGTTSGGDAPGPGRARMRSSERCPAHPARTGGEAAASAICSGNRKFLE